jgi:hypothetical protein
VAPQWQKLEPTPVKPGTTSVQDRSINSGHPLSVLPETVQDSLRAGKSVDLAHVVPVPNR